MRVEKKKKAPNKAADQVKLTGDIRKAKTDELGARFDEQDRSSGSVLLKQFEVREGVKAANSGRFTCIFDLFGVRFT